MSCANTNKAQQGALIGALGGAALGSQFGPGENRGENALIGAGIGMVLGYIIGHEWDRYDQQKLHGTLEHNRSGARSSWTNPDTGNQYAATPSPAYQNDGRLYRDVEIESYVNGKREIIHAKAYRKPDGSWHLVQ